MRVHLRLEQGERGAYLAGQLHEKVAARSLVTVRRCDRHADCWLLHVMQPEKPAKAKAGYLVFTPSKADAERASRGTGA